MPYVDKKTRERLDGDSRGIGVNHPQNVGQLTYDLQQCLKRYLEDRGLSYQTIAECLGALEGAKCDLNVRVVKPYEENKRRENGDVWPSDLTGVKAWADQTEPRNTRLPTGSVHTCSASCPCQHGGTPTPDFIGDAEYDA
jgi:hypothetical protein